MADKNEFLFYKNVVKDTRNTLGSYQETLDDPEKKKTVKDILSVKVLLEEGRQYVIEKFVEKEEVKQEVKQVETNLDDIVFGDFEVQFEMEPEEEQQPVVVDKTYFEDKLPNELAVYYATQGVLRDQSQKQELNEKAFKEVKVQRLSLVQYAKDETKWRKFTAGLLTDVKKNEIDGLDSSL